MPNLQLCVICLIQVDSIVPYPNLVCRECSERAKNVHGGLPQHRGDYDGDNPLYIDRKKCWRIYKFGGYVTILDQYNCNTTVEFLSKYYNDPIKYVFLENMGIIKP